MSSSETSLRPLAEASEAEDCCLCRESPAWRVTSFTPQLPSFQTATLNRLAENKWSAYNQSFLQLWSLKHMKRQSSRPPQGCAPLLSMQLRWFDLCKSTGEPLQSAGCMLRSGRGMCYMSVLPI